MPLVINTNVASLNAQRQLVKSGDDLMTAMERLSSGRRINTAADDAAGLAISNRMTSQIRGLNQAIRNASDGISMIQTAEGALDETTNILQRIRELAIQSANGIYNDENRATLDAEVQQLVSELDRIAATTTFNGQTLLDGSLGDVDLQVGAQSNETISVSIQALDAKTLGLGSQSADVAGTHTANLAAPLSFSEGDILINGQSIGSFDGATDSFEDLLAQINENIEGVTAFGFNEVEAETTGTGVASGGANDTLSLIITDPNGTQATYVLGATTNLDDLVETVNNQTAGKVTAVLNDENKLVLANNTGATIEWAISGTGNAADITAITGVPAADQTAYGQIGLESDSGNEITVTAGAQGTATDLANIGFQENRGDSTVLGGTLNNTALNFGDLTINGVIIDEEDTDTLQGKVDNINAVTDDTGVIANLKAEDRGAFDLSTISTELITLAAQDFTAMGGGDEVIVINGVSITLSAQATDAVSLAAALDAQFSNTGVHVWVDDDNGDIHMFSETNITLEEGANGADVTAALGFNGTQVGAAGAAVTTSASALTDNDTLRINNTEVVLTDVSSIDAVIADINAQQGTTGVFATTNESGEMVLTSNAAFQVSAGNVNGSKVMHVLGLSSDPTAVLNNAPGLELISINGTPISIEVTTAGATNTGLITQNKPSSGTGFGASISSISVATEPGAQKAINVVDNALDTISAIRSDLGAVNNRLDFTISNLMNVSENTTAARSRIMDADFAAETAQLSRAQVLQQASTAMLAQANAQTQQVLQLLNG